MSPTYSQLKGILTELQEAYYAALGVPLYTSGCWTKVEPRANGAEYLEFCAQFPLGLHGPAVSALSRAAYAQHLIRQLGALGLRFDVRAASLLGDPPVHACCINIFGFCTSCEPDGPLTDELLAILPRHLTYHQMARRDACEVLPG